MSTFQTSGSATCVVELDKIKTPPPLQNKDTSPIVNRRLSQAESQKSRSLRDGINSNGSLPSPTTATERLQKWNYPRKNMYRTFAAFWGFIIMGANDAAVGVCDTTLSLSYQFSLTST
jgi:hypothetical protein